MIEKQRQKGRCAVVVCSPVGMNNEKIDNVVFAIQDRKNEEPAGGKGIGRCASL